MKDELKDGPQIHFKKAAKRVAPATEVVILSKVNFKRG
jgi:hypothetical protein